MKLWTAIMILQAVWAAEWGVPVLLRARRGVGLKVVEGGIANAIAASTRPVLETRRRLSEHLVMHEAMVHYTLAEVI
jgi:hypothetical protein